MSEHLIADFYGCETEKLCDAQFIETTLVRAVEFLGATILEKCTRNYSPKGVTAVLVLAESHISAHTWPERGYAALDIYTCGDRTTKQAYEFLETAFHPQQSRAMIVNRGPEIRDGDFEVMELDQISRG